MEPPCPWHLALGVSLPENLRTQNCLNAAHLWLQYKRERKSYYKPTGLKTMVGLWAREFTPATFPMAVEHSMAMNYQGVYARPEDKRGQPARPAPTPSEPDPFDNRPEVTVFELVEKFPSNPNQTKWINALERQGRLRR